jgi:TM2 domain-containing membrane protein YozV
MPVAPSPMQQYPQQQGTQIPGADKKVLAGILGIVLGGLGIHKFVLGYQQEGIIMLAVYLGGWVLSPFTCGATLIISMLVHVMGIVEGIMYLTKSDEEFVNTYIVNKKPWF